MALPNSIKGWVRYLRKKQNHQGDCSLQEESWRDYSEENPFLREVQPVNSDGMAIAEIDNGLKNLIKKISLHEQAKHLSMPREYKEIVVKEYHRLTRELFAKYGVNWGQVMKTKDNVLRRITRPYLFNNGGDGEPENSGTSQPLEKLV